MPITEGHLARHTQGIAGARDPALLDIAQDHALQLLHQENVFEYGLAFKGGTALRKFRAGNEGRFSTDLDFAVAEEDAARHVMKVLNGAEVDGFRFRVEESVPARRARLYVDSPFGPVAIAAGIDINSKALWLEPERLELVTLPIHKQYSFQLPPTPVVRVPELLAEKIARYTHASLARDLYDLFWFSTRIFDESLVRKLAVMKIWWDVTQEGLGTRPFDPEHLLRERDDRNLQRQEIGLLTRPVEIARWQRAFRQRFAFMRTLDEEERSLAQGTLREKRLFDEILARIRGMDAAVA